MQKIKFECSSCGKFNYHLNRHIKSVHEKRKRFRCNLCQKTAYTRSRTIILIMNVHLKSMMSLRKNHQRQNLFSSIKLYCQSFYLYFLAFRPYSCECGKARKGNLLILQQTNKKTNMNIYCCVFVVIKIFRLIRVKSADSCQLMSATVIFILKIAYQL